MTCTKREVNAFIPNTEIKAEYIYTEVQKPILFSNSNNRRISSNTDFLTPQTYIVTLYSPGTYKIIIIIIFK